MRKRDFQLITYPVFQWQPFLITIFVDSRKNVKIFCLVS
jgi:hypothetical protein